MTLNRIPIVIAGFATIFLIQESLVNRINFYVGGFSLYLAFFVAWIVFEERNSALVISFLAGLIADLSPTLEAPFGVWTFIFTGMGYLLASSIRGSIDISNSPLSLTSVCMISVTVALLAFRILSSILGVPMGSLGVVFQVLVGNAMWTFLLAPIFIPITRSVRKMSLTARER